MHFSLRKSFVLSSVCQRWLGDGPAGQAKTFKWANAGDVSSMDPYARNETFLLTFTANIYDPLVRRDKRTQAEPALHRRVRPIRPPGSSTCGRREVRWPLVHRRRRGVLANRRTVPTPAGTSAR